MLILSVYGETIECDKVVKGADYITAYLNGDKIIECNGITDFSGYSLTDEDGNPMEFSAPELDQITQLQLAVVELYEEVLCRG